ncbi:hypothetical protein PF011_g23256 [Phytophthora fragariae]|uniref:Uncharacterized protein n=1 Tax=Phytophthora fragariae TaxID=53985 RepID=A0A6A3IE87_9STRA|nr:hypothetical protein PF011_g23256 [Phytophthora fragariae]
MASYRGAWTLAAVAIARRSGTLVTQILASITTPLLSSCRMGG